MTNKFNINEFSLSDLKFEVVKNNVLVWRHRYQVRKGCYIDSRVTIFRTKRSWYVRSGLRRNYNRELFSNCFTYSIGHSYDNYINMCGHIYKMFFRVSSNDINVAVDGYDENSLMDPKRCILKDLQTRIYSGQDDYTVLPLTEGWANTTIPMSIETFSSITN